MISFRPSLRQLVVHVLAEPCVALMSSIDFLHAMKSGGRQIVMVWFNLKQMPNCTEPRPASCGLTKIIGEK